jgi:alcohol dehydrogenase class IV
LISRIDKIFSAKQFTSLFKPGVLVVCAKTVYKNFIKDAIKGVPNVYIFNDVIPEPDETVILKAFEFSKELPIHSILAIGGGSVIDVAKLLNVKLSFPESPLLRWTTEPIPKLKFSVTAIPTTAGTGSEITKYSVFYHEIENRKVTIKDERIVPENIFLYPELTVNLPEKITIDTAFDAFIQGLEPYLYFDDLDVMPYAFAAMKIVYSSLGRLIESPSNLSLRYNMQLAAYFSGIAITRLRTGLIHTAGNHFGAFTGLSHGASLAVLTKDVLIHLKPECSQKFEFLKDFLGIPKEKDFIEQINSFIDEIGILNNIKPINVSSQMVSEMTLKVHTDKDLFKISPIALNSQVIETIYNDSIYTLGNRHATR